MGLVDDKTGKKKKYTINNKEREREREGIY